MCSRYKVNLFSVILLGVWLFSLNARASSVQLAVFETRNCDYCQMFHKDVADDYSNSWPGRIAPLSRILVSNYRSDRFELKAPIQVVPTFVLIEDGKELLRITGYFGRQNFFQIMTSVLRDYR